MVDLWREVWMRENGPGQQVAQLHDIYDDDDDDDDAFVLVVETALLHNYSQLDTCSCELFILQWLLLLLPKILTFLSHRLCMQCSITYLASVVTVYMRVWSYKMSKHKWEQ